jgi:hypothetical protein
MRYMSLNRNDEEIILSILEHTLESMICKPRLIYH